MCNVGWAVAVILLVWFVVNKIQEANDRHVLAVQKVQEELQGVKSAYADGVDWFNSYASNQQKAAWYHFSAQLKKDEAVTIEQIESAYEKEIKCEHGDSPLYGSYNN